MANNKSLGPTRVIPHDASEDQRRVFHALWDEIERLGKGNRDFNQNRLTNLDKGRRSDDAVTKGQLDDAVEGVTASTAQAIKKVRVAISGSIPAVGASGSGSGSGGGSSEFPPANHSIDFGYYFVDSKFGQFEGEVKAFTNLAYIGPNNMLGVGSPASDIQAALALGMARLGAAGIKMLLDVEAGSLISIDQCLSAAAPYWDKVKYVNYNGDWGGTKAALNSGITTLRNKIAAMGLADRPIGITNDGATFTGDWVDAEQLNYVLVECYSLDPANHGTNQQNIDSMVAAVNKLKARVDAGKQVGLIFQGYDRNGVFTPITPDLVDMQGASYLLGNVDTRVPIMLIFSYARSGGTQAHPELKVKHQAMWSAIQGATGGSGTGGGTGGGTGSGATDCGQGRPCCGGVTGSNCPRWCSGGDYEQQFFAAQGAFIAGAPATVVDPSNRNFIIDSVAYMNGIVAQFNADNPTLIAIFEPGNDGKQAAVKAKGDSTKSEHYKCWSGGGANTIVRYLYAATCYGARFEG